MNTVIAQSAIPRVRLRTGEAIPAIGLGTFGSDAYSAEQVSQAVYGAIKAGYRLIDCAAIYQNEAQIGEVLARVLDEGIVRREALFIASKVWNDMHGEGEVIRSCEKSLADLRLGHLDLFLVHWPFPNPHAPGCDGEARNPDARPFDPEEFMVAWRQCEQLVKAGLVRHIGMSNMTIAKLEAVLPLCEILPATLEMELHPSFQQQALFDYARAHGIVPVGFCPLGSPSRPERDKSPTDVSDMQLPEVLAVAQAHGVHPALICLKWAVQRGQIPIPFSVKEAQYTSNLLAVTQDPLTRQELALLAHAERNCRLVKGQVFLWPGALSWRALWDEAEGITTESEATTC